MKTQESDRSSIYPHVSVDCVLISIIDGKLSVLLIEQYDANGAFIGYKLPGDFIYVSEDVDDAAHRVAKDSTGLKNVPLTQFHCFGSLSRTKKANDERWVENLLHLKIDRIITIAYFSFCDNVSVKKINRNSNACKWFATSDLPYLPFDHKEISDEAVKLLRVHIQKEPAMLISHLPPKFTATQLRLAYEAVYDTQLDVRNFHKKMTSMKYIVLTDELEEGVSHRAARYYKFDRVMYNRTFASFKQK